MNVPENTPRVYKDTLRWTILMYAATDPPFSWTVKQMVREMKDMGHNKRAATNAISGLRTRGLITTKPWRGAQRVMPTSAGCRAMRKWTTDIHGVTA